MIPNDLEGIVIEIDGNGTANTKRPAIERNPRVFAYMYGLARRLERDGRHGTADNYRCATAALGSSAAAILLSGSANSTRRSWPASKTHCADRASSVQPCRST